MLENAVKIGLNFRFGMTAVSVMFSKYIVQCGLSYFSAVILNLYFSCGIVYRTIKCTVNTTKIYDEFTVNVKPEIVVSGKFIDNVVSPVIKTIRCLDKGRLKFNTELIIGILDF